MTELLLHQKGRRHSKEHKRKAEAYATLEGVVSATGGALKEGVALDGVGSGRIRDTRFCKYFSLL
jgi:hypothetical protein